MDSSIAQPILNERHETRINFLKKDKVQLCKRLEDVEERLSSTKSTLQRFLSYCSPNLGSEEQSAILDYLIEEKNYLSRRILEIESENKEALEKSMEQKKRINEIIQREPSIEGDFMAKLEAVLKESKEKEESIQKLSLKNEKLSKEFKDLAKNRLNTSVNPKEIPILLEKKQNAIKRVVGKIHDYSKYLDGDISHIEATIERDYKELCRLNSQAKFPFKIIKPLEEFLKPTIHNLVQADIRAKVEIAPIDPSNYGSLSVKAARSNKIQSKLEEKFIKIESLCNELKTAEIINQSLKEDKNYLLSSSSHLNSRRGNKLTTCKANFVDSFKGVHKRVVSNPLDYCSKEFFDVPQVNHGSKNDIEGDLSKALDDFSSVEDNYYEAPGDSIIDDILDI